MEQEGFCVHHIKECEHYLEGSQGQLKESKQGNDGKSCVQRDYFSG